MRTLLVSGVWLLAGILHAVTLLAEPIIIEYPVPDGAHPHDVAPATDGRIWYTAQHQEALGWIDPETGGVGHIALGKGSRPHGVIVGPDGDAWITDSGLNAMVRFSPDTEQIEYYPLPTSDYANLNTATFDSRGVLWFTGQSGIYGRLDPETRDVSVFDAPRGRGPYGIATSPDGSVYYASLAGNYLGRIDLATGEAEILQPPTRRQGARRVWSDSKGVQWITGWNSGDLIRYDPATETWREWKLPGFRPQPYAVYVDERDVVWISDFSANAIVMFDPESEEFTTIAIPSRRAQVRQLLGRPGEVWGAESGTDKLVVVRY